MSSSLEGATSARIPSHSKGYSRSWTERLPSGIASRQTPWKPSQPVESHVGHLEAQVPAVAQARGDEVLDHLLLPVDGDRSPARELAEVDAMAPSIEAQLEAVVHQPFAVQALADAGA